MKKVAIVTTLALGSVGAFAAAGDMPAGITAMTTSAATLAGLAISVGLTLLGYRLGKRIISRLVS